MALNPTTKLQAVNICLNNVGQPSVANLDVAVPVDAQIAFDTIDEVSRETQNVGFIWNTERLWIEPDENGYIHLPKNILKADVCEDSFQLDVVQRGLRMYDRANNTFKFKSKIKVEVIVALDFEEISEAARRFITVRAARLFQERMFGSVEISQFNADDEAIARSNLAHEETENGDYNLVYQNFSSLETLNRYGR